MVLKRIVPHEASLGKGRSFMEQLEQRILEKLEWPLLLHRLSGLAQSDEGKEICASLGPNLTRAQIEDRWAAVTPLRDIARSGYKAPIGGLKKMHHIFKGAEKGMIFDGVDLRLVYDLLMAVKRTLGFVQSFAARSPLLQKVRGQIYALPDLFSAIEKAVGSEGTLLDTASEELQAIRRQKVALRKRIEDTVTKLLYEPSIMEYLQDNFFTVRNEKYVIPMRLDGRGRIKGQIVDTSDSGQTLFLEPVSIAPMNEQLHDLDVAEKLEIIRIFREISAVVAREVDILRVNYSQLLDLDILSAEAALAAEFDAGPVVLSNEPCLDLVYARHPLIKTTTGKGAEPNTITIEKNQRILVVSGPNAGGKTVVLKTVGLLQLMARAGLLLPADPSSKVFLFEGIYLELGDAQDITSNLSTFSGHIKGLKPILENAKAHDLVLLDELATGTEPQTGAAIARAVLEHLAGSGVTGVVTTHYDSLKSLAIGDHRYRNGSMEYAEATYQPTYRLILDVPGQSYGLEVARQIGLPAAIIDRARELRGSKLSDLDEAVQLMNRARQESEQMRKKLEAELLAAEEAKARWDHECALLEEQRGKAARGVAAKYEDQVGSLKSEFEEATKKLKEAVKEVREGQRDSREVYDEKRKAEEKLREIDRTVAKLSEAGINQELPGRPATLPELREKLNVYVVPLRREGAIVKMPSSPTEPFEVQVGIVKLRVGIQDLRITRGADVPKGEQKGGGPRSVAKAPSGAKPAIEALGFVPQTPTNTIDLRGMDADSAVQKALNFIDKALLRGESAVVLVHGHGSDRLKLAIRHMLKSDCPYDVAFRAGEGNEGGDGVTVVALRT